MVELANNQAVSEDSQWSNREIIRAKASKGVLSAATWFLGGAVEAMVTCQVTPEGKLGDMLRKKVGTCFLPHLIFDFWMQCPTELQGYLTISGVKRTNVKFKSLSFRTRGWTVMRSFLM